MQPRGQRQARDPAGVVACSRRPHAPILATRGPTARVCDPCAMSKSARRAISCCAAATLAACDHPRTPSRVDAKVVEGGDAAGPDASERPDATPLPPQTARLRVASRCAEPIWIAPLDNLGGDQDVELAAGAYHDYDIPAGGVASARFWPKTGCDATGHACATGDTGEGSGAPCGAHGCQPPFDSKLEVTFAASGSSDSTYYNLSLVDGYTLPFTVTPL